MPNTGGTEPAFILLVLRAVKVRYAVSSAVSSFYDTGTFMGFRRHGIHLIRGILIAGFYDAVSNGELAKEFYVFFGHAQ